MSFRALYVINIIISALFCQTGKQFLNNVNKNNKKPFMPQDYNIWSQRLTTTIKLIVMQHATCTV